MTRFNLCIFSRNGSFARSYPNLGICGTSASAPNSPSKKSKVNLQQIRLHHEVTGDIICPSMVMGKMICLEYKYISSESNYLI